MMGRIIILQHWFNYLLYIRVLLEREMEVVKTGMQHGDLSLDAYTQVGILPPSSPMKLKNGRKLRMLFHFCDHFFSQRFN